MKSIELKIKPVRLGFGLAIGWHLGKFAYIATIHILDAILNKDEDDIKDKHKYKYVED